MKIRVDWFSKLEASSQTLLNVVMRKKEFPEDGMNLLTREGIGYQQVTMAG